MGRRCRVVGFLLSLQAAVGVAGVRADRGGGVRVDNHAALRVARAVVRAVAEFEGDGRSG